MATIAVGDIHGNLPALDDLLDRLAPILGPCDTLVFLGDYIDRGRCSKGCIERVLRVRRESTAAVVTLLGNHEQWLSRTLRDPTHHSWLVAMEGLTTVESYSPRAARSLREEIARLGPRIVTGRAGLPYEEFFDSIPREHREFLENLEVVFRADGVICVHGGIDSSLGGLDDQSVDAMVWGGDGFPEDYREEDTIVYGHRNDFVLDERGWPRPRTTGRAIGIDTISTGVLTAVVLPGGEVIQSARHFG